jgi:helix-turn-helix, Psq domain
MTTSQASRIFGIPYNSLLMYVRGKYGKSLKLEQLRKDCISGPPIELLQMGPTAQANENKKKDKSGHDGDEGQSSRENNPHNHPSNLKRSVSSEPDMMMGQNSIFNPFQGGFYPDFPGSAAGFPGLQLSMLNLLPPDARMHHHGMMPMVLDDDCKSENGSVQSLEDSLQAEPLNLNRDKNEGSSGPGSNRQTFQN